MGEMPLSRLGIGSSSVNDLAKPKESLSSVSAFTLHRTSKAVMCPLPLNTHRSAVMLNVYSIKGEGAMVVSERKYSYSPNHLEFRTCFICFSPNLFPSCKSKYLDVKSQSGY